MPTVRRTCPACSRRYAGVVDPSCPVCDGIGVLALGAAALSIATPPAAARGVELYLEASSRRARDTLPIGVLAEALTVAVDEARLAGLLADRLESGTPAHRLAEQARTLDEAHGITIARRLEPEVDDRDRAGLDPRAVAPLTLARPRPGAVPILSRAGYRSQLARAADPIHPLDSVQDLALAHDAAAHRARVLAAAAEDLVTRRNRAANRRARGA